MPALSNRERRRRLRREFESKPGTATAAGSGGGGGGGGSDVLKRARRAYRQGGLSALTQKQKEAILREHARNQNGGGGGGNKPKPPKPAPFLYTPGQPGVANKPIQPFMTAEDLFSQGEAEYDFSSRMQQLDYELDKLRSESEYEKSEIDRGALRSRTDANDLMASRGMFHSSVRDAELFDIDATAAIRKNFLDRELDSAALNTQTQKMAAQQAWDTFQSSMRQQMVENATEAGEGMTKWAKEPVKENKHLSENQANQAAFLASWQEYLDDLKKWERRKKKKDRNRRRRRN